MAIHYKLPLDEEIDRDIIDWIDSLPRMKKGEMIRHAIRYYMAVLGEGEKIKFPNVNTNTVAKQESTSPEKSKPVEREKPAFNIDAMKGRV